MAYDENLAERVRELLTTCTAPVQEKRMMGGLCFMVDGKMCVGVDKQRLMVRIDPEIYHSALSLKGAAPMDITGKPLRGFVFVDSTGTKSRSDLKGWVALALEFNPRAVASKPRRSTTAKVKAVSKLKKPRR